MPTNPSNYEPVTQPVADESVTAPPGTKGDLTNACNVDNDCRLVDTIDYGNCCKAEIDLSQARWIAVNETNTAYPQYGCTAMCIIGANKIVNDKFSPHCANGFCQKLADDSGL